MNHGLFHIALCLTDFWPASVGKGLGVKTVGKHKGTSRSISGSFGTVRMTFGQHLLRRDLAWQDSNTGLAKPALLRALRACESS